MVMHDDSAPTEGGDVSGNANALAKGTRLFEFEIERVLGEGGFAIVYLAFDHSLHRHVALKEYLPAEFAFRQDENTIVLRSMQHQKTFEAGRRSFVQEARFLAQFEHASLVKVHRVFESNGTAYMVQGYYPGQSLSAVLKTGRRYASDAELRPIVAPLLSAVELLHSRQCLHRDIAPDNIIIQPNGMPVLLDFGAARRIIGDMTQALTAVLKPSYAPIEQYTEDGGLAQGPWTDVYALAATLRMAITGKPPPSSVGRTIKDALVKLADDPPGNFDLTFLRGIDAGLALLPADRPQTIGDFRAAMGIEPEEEATMASSTKQVPAPAPRVAAPAAVAATITVARPQIPAPPPPPPPPPAPAVKTTARKRFKRSDAMLAVIAGLAVALMLVVPFAADWIWPSPASNPAPRVARETRPATTPPAPAPAPALTLAPAPAPAVTPAPTSPAPSVASAPVTPPPKDTKPPPPPEKAPAPSPAAPPPAPTKVASAPAPEPAPAPKQEVPAKPAPILAPLPPPSTSLIPAPSTPVAPANAPTPIFREEAPPKPAAAPPPPQTASIAPPPEPAKARRSLVRVSGEPPVYPRDAIRAGIESGRVVALVTVDAQGNVADIDIVRSEPPRIFDRAARTALALWKFKAEGERYQGEVELRFNFRE
jgi:TonB family protein